ncbi:MAG: Ppx/GppA phosphatase family protein [Acidimicrobiia bacterium]
MRVAVLDLGSNSFRLQLSEIDATGTISGIHQERRMLHLGGVVALEGRLPDDVAERAVGTARGLVDVAERIGTDRVFVVATAALREAANGAEVVERLGTAVGVPVKVVDGDEEARLAFIGAQAAIRLDPGDRLVADLGGGSLELAAGEGRTVRWSTTHPLGVSRLHAELGGRERLKGKHRRAIEAAVDRELETVDQPIPDQVVVVGGAVRALAELVLADRGGWVPPSVNHARLTLDDLASVTDRLAPLTASERVDEHDVSEARAANLPIAGVVLTAAMDRLGIESVTVSDWGLRTGLLVDALDLDLPDGEAVWRRSAAALADRFLPDDPHPGTVAGLVDQLWPQLRPLHELGEDDRRIVVVAALLHDIGKALALDGHHRHSAYLVEHAALRGLTPDELAAVLALVRYHRGGPPRRRYAPYGSLSGSRRREVRRMSAVLQLADALDRSRDGAVERVVVGDDGATLMLRLEGRDPRAPEPGPSAFRLEHVAKELGRRLEFVVAPARDPWRPPAHP